MQRALVLMSLLISLSGWANAQFINGAPSTAQGEIDLSGGWLQKIHQDAREQSEAEIGDYTGFPVNDANRMRADTWDSAKWSVPEHQCEPHPADYALHGPANLQISKIVDPRSLKTVAIQVMLGWMTPIRTIWLDNRASPSPYAPRTWMGFSLGRWEGDTLVVTTTHLKEGWLRRNGLARSEKARLTEYWLRRGDVLTVASVIDDPVYLTEPLFRTHSWVLDAGVHITPYTCVAKLESDRPPGYVAHYLPGTNPFLLDYARQRNIPQKVAEGGAAQMYPEYQETMRKMIEAETAGH